MTKDDCYELGKITKTHGVKGEVILWLDVDMPEVYDDLESVFLDVDGNLVPFFIETYQLRGNRAIVQFEDINSFEKAEALINRDAFLPLTALSALEGDEFYYHEVIGFTVIDQEQGTLGIVQTIYSMQAQDILVMLYKDCEVLIPINNSIVLRADKEAKKVYVNIPEGLVEVYTSDN